MIILTLITRIILGGVFIGGLSVLGAILTQVADKEQWK